MESQLITMLSEGKINNITKPIPDDGLDTGAYAEQKQLLDVMNGVIDVVKVCPSIRTIKYPDGRELTYMITGADSVEYHDDEKEFPRTKAQMEFFGCVGAIVCCSEVVAVLPRHFLEVG